MSNIETITDKGHTRKLNEEDGGTILTSHQIVLYIQLINMAILPKWVTWFELDFHKYGWNKGLPVPIDEVHPLSGIGRIGRVQ